jgi:hypothetical protein
VPLELFSTEKFRTKDVIIGLAEKPKKFMNLEVEKSIKSLAIFYAPLPLLQMI